MSQRKHSKIDPREFMDTCEELHAFTHGLCEVVCPWSPYRKAMAEERAKELEAEYHYYLLGRAVGVLVWLGLAAAIKGIFF